MQNIFEVTKIRIDDKDYRFNVMSVTREKGYTDVINPGYGVGLPRIEKEIKRLFFQGYDDSRLKRRKQKTFIVPFKLDDIVTYNHLKSVFKQAYEYGYKKSQDEKKEKHYIDDLNIQNPSVESKLKIFINQIFDDGFNDAKNNKLQKYDFKIPDDFYFINDINDLLVRVYNDGYEEGKELIETKYKFNLPKINDQELIEDIEKKIISAYADGLDDFKKEQERKKSYIHDLFFIKDKILKIQVSNLIDQAYNDGYDSHQKKLEDLKNKKIEEDKVKEKEQQELYYLIKKYGKLKTKKFTSYLYQYAIQDNEFKISPYEFTNINSDNKNVLNQVNKNVLQAFSKGKDDASNGLEKQFFIFSMPVGIKDNLTKKKVADLINKSYNDGYDTIIDEIYRNVSSEINKNNEQKKLEELLQKQKKYTPIKKITNLSDRFINSQIYLIEVPIES